MVSPYLIVAQSQESSRVVVENVLLLLLGQKFGRLDPFDRQPECLGKPNTVCSEHEPTIKTGVDKALQVFMEGWTRITPVDPG